ncbi:MAG TPA: DMT family transporter, partial [Gaiellaceae bacterium]|nr:DMT family transporter [Gaiellaceae bacterium]
MTPVLLALGSAVLFGAMTVALRLALRGHPEPDVGAVASTVVAVLVAAGAAALDPGTGELSRPKELAVFALAGLLAPGISQILFVLAVRDAGASRTAVVVGSAPLVAATMAIILLDEPFEWALALGAVLIVGAGLLLVGEPVRSTGFRLAGIGFALGATVLFSSRDLVVRWYSDEASLGSIEAAAAALAAGAAVMVAWAAVVRRGALVRALATPALLRFLPAGVFFGLSYVLLFEAYYRGRVTVVSPLVATESLWGVLLSALVLRQSEHVGARLVACALLVVAGGALIGASR